MNLLTQFSKTATAPFVLLLSVLSFELLTAMELVEPVPDTSCLWPGVVMVVVDVWFHCLDGINQTSRDRATCALAQEGIICRSGGTGSAPPFGLIVFDKETPDLLEFVHRSSRDGFDRIMAVALNKTALTGATPWKLLQAGASDVLAWRHKGPCRRYCGTVRALASRGGGSQLRVGTKQPGRPKPCVGLCVTAGCGGRSLYGRFCADYRRKWYREGTYCASYSHA